MMNDGSKDASEPNDAAHDIGEDDGELEHPFHVDTVEELHARNLYFSERAARAGNISATMDALLYCRENDLKAPAWLLRESFDLLVVAIRGTGKKKGPGGNLLARYRQDMKHFVRWDTVEVVREKQREFSENVRFAESAKNKADPDELAHWKNIQAALGETLESARAATSKLLAGTAAAGSEDTIATSWKLVRACKPGRFKMPGPKVLHALDMSSPFDSDKPIHELLEIPTPKWELKRPPTQ